MRFMDNMNSHEQRIMKPVIYIKYLTIIVCILDLAIPLFHEYRIGATSIFSWIIVIAFLWSLFGTLGILPRTNPIFIIGLMRIIQLAIGIYNEQLIYITFIIVSILDLVLCFYIASDMEKFENKSELIRRTGD